MKVSLPNGAPAIVTDAPAGRGGTWTASGVMVFGPDLILSGLSRVSADGGNAEPATLLDLSQGETAHQWPVALPDGVHFLYFVRAVNPARRGIYLGRLDRPAAPATVPLFHSDSGAVYVPLAGTEQGDLLYFFEGRVEARRFDPVSLRASANARTVDFLPDENSLSNPVMVSASADVMAFAESVVPSGNLVASFTMSGESLRTWEKSEAQNWPRVSPDGQLLARQHIDETRSQPDIWVEDLERGTVYPVTRTIEPDMAPVWSPDGRQLALVTGHLPGRTGELNSISQLRMARASSAHCRAPAIIASRPTGAGTGVASPQRPGIRQSERLACFGRVGRPRRTAPHCRIRRERCALLAQWTMGRVRVQGSGQARGIGPHAFRFAETYFDFRRGWNAACLAP